MPENKRVKTVVTPVRVNPADISGSIQSVIESIESKGNYVMQYVSFGAFEGVVLSHDYPDRKNVDESKKKPVTPPTEPSGEPAKPVTDELVTRDPIKDSAIEMAKDHASKGKGKGKKK